MDTATPAVTAAVVDLDSGRPVSDAELPGAAKPVLQG
jgi:hypothetical protein